MAGRMINGAAALAELVRVAGDTEESGVHRVLPVAPELSGLLPGRGLRRGSTVAVATGTSLLLALLGEASRTGSWCAVVGVPSLGTLAAAESGIALERLALVPNPGPEWPTVVAALIDGVDMVVVAMPGPVSASIASRLVARARQRGSVLVPFGPWSGADLTLQVTDGRWEGLDTGHGRLRRRRVTIVARGRGAAARPREVTMWMPGLVRRPFTLPPAPVFGDADPPGAVAPARPDGWPAVPDETARSATASAAYREDAERNPATNVPAAARPARFLVVVPDPPAEGHSGDVPEAHPITAHEERSVAASREHPVAASGKRPVPTSGERAAAAGEERPVTVLGEAVAAAGEERPVTALGERAAAAGEERPVTALGERAGTASGNRASTASVEGPAMAENGDTGEGNGVLVPFPGERGRR